MDLAWTSRARVAASLFGSMFALASGCANNSSADSCDPACPAFTLCCGDGTGAMGCAEIVNDPLNCGGCGIACPSGVCREARCQVVGAPDGGLARDAASGSECQPSCGPNDRCCGTSCVALSGVAVGTDGREHPTFSSCRSCGDTCDRERASACSVPGSGGGTPRCMCGSRDQCAADELCLVQGGSFGCVRTSTDPDNCGAPGVRCAAGERCTGGMCQCGDTGATCGGNQTCCGASCVDLSSDLANCGACGNACLAGETCAAGQCRCGEDTCDRPMAGFPGTSCGEICCAGQCQPVDAANCGACGSSCTGEGNVCGILSPLLPDPSAPLMAPSCGPPTELAIPPLFRRACDGAGLPDGGLGF